MQDFDAKYQKEQSVFWLNVMLLLTIDFFKIKLTTSALDDLNTAIKMFSYAVVTINKWNTLSVNILLILSELQS